ncbi:Cthe_2314 family HEPN domain-containing protein [Paenibacillus sepulcri]|uniref:Cthe-2314-like HEPN domain-containing protein n=1 Tax=Paenibacillus sepulcri TaxID=359917 RepID=A0ABS7BYP1_9BACL|nr:hypothetical protein [Paenibacillus sepulcri]
MLRMLFDDPPRKAEGKLHESMQLMKRFASMLHDSISKGKDSEQKLRKYEIWTLGLIVSLDELEQSQYAARKFANKVKSTSMESMSPDELLDYHRHVYFDKNAFIRLFALLDKLGTLMNEFLNLQTERIKVHFSYFTVLRGMRQRNLHPLLISRLDALKEQYKEPLGRLRKRRNTEIHYMNSEMQDDLQQSYLAYGEHHRLENLQERCDDLTQGMELIYDTLLLAFDHACKHMRKRI